MFLLYVSYMSTVIILVWNNLKYRDHGFVTYFDFLQAICNNWFKEKVLASDRLSTFQKVLEVLALYPKISFNDLVKKVGEDESKIHEFFLCTYIDLEAFNIEMYYQMVLTNDYSKEYSGFIVEHHYCESTK